MLARSVEEKFLGDGKGGGFPNLPGFPPASSAGPHQL